MFTAQSVAKEQQDELCVPEKYGNTADKIGKVNTPICIENLEHVMIYFGHAMT